VRGAARSRGHYEVDFYGCERSAVAACERRGFRRGASVMGEGSATALPGDLHHSDAVPVQYFNRRSVDLGC